MLLYKIGLLQVKSNFICKRFQLNTNGKRHNKCKKKSTSVKAQSSPGQRRCSHVCLNADGHGYRTAVDVAQFLIDSHWVGIVQTKTSIFWTKRTNTKFRHFLANDIKQMRFFSRWNLIYREIINMLPAMKFQKTCILLIWANEYRILNQENTVLIF